MARFVRLVVEDDGRRVVVGVRVELGAAAGMEAARFEIPGGELVEARQGVVEGGV